MAAAELKLQVGLDLAFFRQQLAQLGSVSVGYQLPINIKFDRLGIQQELNRLATNINRRKYRLEIATNIKSETEAAQKLDAALDAIKDRAINVKFAGTGDLDPKEARKIRTALSRSILSNGGKIKIPSTILAAITQDDITAFTRAAQAKLKEIALNVRADITSSADGLDTKEVRKIRVALRNAVLSNGGKIKIPATIQPSISNDEVASFRKLVQEKFKGITVTVGVEPQVASKGAAAQGNPRGYETALESLKRLNPEQLRSRAMKSLGEESRTAQQISNWVDILQADKGMGRGDKNKQLAAIRNVLAKALAESVGQDIEARLQPLRGQKTMEAPRSASNINKILDPIANFTQNPGVARRMLRMLPESQISTNVLDVASRQARYYESVPSAREMQGKIKGFDPLMKAIASNFSDYTRSLSTTDPWIGRIGKGIAQIVSTAAASPQAQKLLPAAGQSSASKMMRSAFAGLPAIQAPSIGQENAPLSRAATYSLNKARRILGMPIGPSSVYAPNPFAGAATVPPTAAVSGGFGLPPAGTTSNYSATARRAAWAQAYQQFRPMQAPSVPPPMQPPGPPVPPNPPTPPSGGRGGFGSFGGFRGAMPNLSLPGAGLVKEVGDQFGYAAKQVLLFGAAYKALAFLTDFPAKVGEAIGQLQTFRNTLQSITPDADEFQKSNQFILDTVDKYNTPLQSARDGFTKLYASMAPAGFKGDDIRNIFAGISQGAATFGMSADKVDRVNYAFAQMASKGQVMSEELKGQLGDVLPGAVAIFAKAAGFEGPEAMVKFTKAMEDGRYKGEAMKQLLINVGIVMKDKFAAGAEGAAQTFQGQMNAMANATKKLYEAFVPAGNIFASKIIAPLTKGLTVVTDGFKAYFDGQRAVNPEAEKLNKILETLVPSLQGIAQNVLFAVKQLAPFAQVVGFVVLQVSRLLALPFVRYLAATYLQVLVLTTAFNALATAGVTAAIASLAQFTKGMILHAGVAMGLTRATQQSTFAMYQFGTTVQTVMIRSIVGIALVAIGALIARIADLKGQLASIGNDARGMEELAKSSAKMGDVQGTKEAFGNIEDRLKTIKELRKELSGAKRIEMDSTFSDRGAMSNSFKLPIKDDTAKKLIELGYVSKKFLTKTADGYTILEHNLEEVNAKIAAGEEAFSRATQNKNILIDQSIRKSKELKRSVLGAIPDPIDDTKRNNLESYYKLEDDLAKAVTQGEIDKANMLFEHRKNLMDTYYDLQDARANSFQKATIKFQREVANIEMKRQQNVLNARNAVRKAEGSVAGGAPGGTGAIFGDTGRTFNAKGFVHGHFQNQNREALVQDTVEVVLNLLSKGVSPELGSGARFTSGMNAKQVEALVRQGIGSHKQYASGASAVDVFVPKGTQVPVPVSGIQNLGGAGGFTGSLARGSQLMHLDPASRTLGVGAARRVAGNESRDINAAQKTRIELDKENLRVQYANVLALKEQRVATENYVASIMPVAELELQNQLQDRRNQLQLAGVSDAVLEYEMAKTKAALGQLSVEQALQALKEKKAKTPLTDIEAVELERLQTVLDGLKANHSKFYAALAGNQAGQIQSAYSSNMGSLRNQLQLASIIDPYEEQRQKYMQGGQSAGQADEQVRLEKQRDSVTKLRDSYRELASTIGTSFGDAFKGIITGSMTAQEALASFFQNLSNYFADMVSKMIAEWLKVEAIKGLKSLLPNLFGGGGFAFTGDSGFGATAFGSGFQVPGFAFANGGIAPKGFQAFATGGIVTGPTLGLVGEGRYNEAVIPLPDGKSVPVDLGGMSGGMSNAPIVVNVSVDAKGSTVEGDETKANDLGRAISVAVQSELVKQQRPGGLLASTRR